jgi:hypothetical protein
MWVYRRVRNADTPFPILAVILRDRSAAKGLLLAFLAQGWETIT